MQSKIVPVSVAARSFGITPSDLHALIKKYRIKTTPIPTIGARGRAIVKGVDPAILTSKIPSIRTTDFVLDRPLKKQIQSNPSFLDMTVRELLIGALRG